MSIIPFSPGQDLPPEAGRFALVTKSRNARRRTRSCHDDVQEAGRELASLIPGEVPADMDWAAIFDMTKGSLSDPSTPALLLCVFHRKGAARVGQLAAAGRDGGAPANGRRGRDG
jgi:hypothetical protein